MPIMADRGRILGRNGRIAGSRACCCNSANCCCDLWGRNLRATLQWGCTPVASSPAPIFVTLTWNGTDKCWRGTKTGWCTAPPDFTLEAVCAVESPSLPPTLSFPLNGGVCGSTGTPWLRIFTATTTSGWRHYGCLPETVTDVFDGVLHDSSCCSFSPGALKSIKLEAI